jgi:hypothetical protein
MKIGLMVLVTSIQVVTMHLCKKNWNKKEVSENHHDLI